MREIGGYFELELQERNSFHAGAIALNSGRNCLEYLIESKQITSIYLPIFTCEVIFEVCKNKDVEIIYYHVNESLEIIDEIPLNAYLLYTNYFGLKGDYVKSLSTMYLNLIVDNAQALFDEPLHNVDTFYSPRKFVGLPDGGFLYTNCIHDFDFPKAISQDRISHHITRIEQGAQKGYNDFVKNDDVLKKQAILQMSNFTKKVFHNIDFDEVKRIRKENFEYLHSELKKTNSFKFSVSNNIVPMVYPFWIKGVRLHEEFIKKKVFIATYWPNVLKDNKSSENETQFANELLPLPIDQRYSIDEMKFIVSIIRKYVRSKN